MTTCDLIRRPHVLASLSLVLLASGCVLRAVRDGVETVEISSTISGRLRVGAEWTRSVVALLREDNGGRLTLDACWESHRPGAFYFHVRPGTYYVVAFPTTSIHEGYRPGVPLAWYGEPTAVQVGQGREVTGIELLQRGAPAERARPLEQALRWADVSSFTRWRRTGELASLADERFSRETGRVGLWSPALFAQQVGWGLFLLEPYDSGKTPVVFVHGAGGYPQEWEFLSSRLDRSHFQPWFFQYASGARLQVAVDVLGDMLDELKSRHRFTKLVIVAHSAGGLVARMAIGQARDLAWPQDVALFVSISTPWQGQNTARMGVEHSPFVVPAWLDIAPGSEFLLGVRQQALPARAAYHLLFGYRGGSSFIAPGSSDGSVTLQSMLDRRAQEEAAKIHGFDEDHESILRSEAVASVLRSVMDSAARAR